MSDARLRLLERRWHEEDSVEAWLALVRYCERLGLIRCDMGLHDVRGRHRPIVERNGREHFARRRPQGFFRVGASCASCRSIVPVHTCLMYVEPALSWFLQSRESFSIHPNYDPWCAGDEVMVDDMGQVVRTGGTLIGTALADAAAGESVDVQLCGGISQNALMYSSLPADRWAGGSDETRPDSPHSRADSGGNVPDKETARIGPKEASGGAG